MTRSAFLSAGGDPFIALLTMKMWKERWHDEVTTFYVDYNNNSHVPQEVAGEFLNKASQDPKVNIIYHPTGIGNGMPITEMTKTSRDELVMLIEDDGFIFDSGYVDECFKKIETKEYDVVGSDRFSCGLEIGEAEAIKYGLDYSGFGDRGPNQWPNFFFCRRDHLLRTDMNFGSIHFEPGQYCEQLNWTFKEVTNGDTFVWACIQLRHMGLKFLNIPQHHASPFEIEEKNGQMGNWHESQKPFHWIHGGSLSSSWNGYLSGAKYEPKIEIEFREMETRCAFWEIASDVIEGFDEFKKQYKQGIKNLIASAGLDSGRINQKINVYRQLLRV